MATNTQATRHTTARETVPFRLRTALHETDFYDEVEQIWGRRWGAEVIEVPVDEYWDLALNGVTLAPGKVTLELVREQDSAPSSPVPA